MLFELIYVTSTGQRPPSPKSVVKAVQMMDHIEPGRASGDETHFQYRNDDTQVECRFVRYEPDEDDEVGLAFEMKLPRPTFFALEALPVAVAVARELRTSVEILLEDGSKFVEKPTVEDILDEWKAANERVRQEEDVSVCAPDDLEAMWEFMMLRPELARRYGRNGVRVPPVRLYREKRTGKVVRMSDWEKLGPVAFGNIEWVRLVDPPQPLKDDSFYRTDELFAALKPLVRVVPQPIYHHLCDRRGIRSELAEKISEFKRKTGRSFEALNVEQVVDDPEMT